MVCVIHPSFDSYVFCFYIMSQGKPFSTFFTIFSNETNKLLEIVTVKSKDYIWFNFLIRFIFERKEYKW